MRLIVPHTINVRGGVVSCLRLNEDELRAEAFLDERVSPALVRRSVSYSFSEFIQRASLMPSSSANLRQILHSGYSGSTAISRSLAETDQLVVYREPIALVTFAETYLTTGQPPITLLAALLNSYSQVWRPNQIPILKPSSRTLVIYNLLAELVQSSLLLTATKSSFVSSITSSRARRSQSLHNLRMAIEKLKQQDGPTGPIIENIDCVGDEDLSVAGELFDLRRALLARLSLFSGTGVHYGRDIIHKPECFISTLEEVLDFRLTPESRNIFTASKFWSVYAKPLL